MFRLPCLLALQVAPTAQARSPAGSQVVYATQWTGSYLPELWYRYMTESDNYHDGTFTRWIAALSAATCNVRVNLSRGDKLLRIKRTYLVLCLINTITYFYAALAKVADSEASRDNS